MINPFARKANAKQVNDLLDVWETGYNTGYRDALDDNADRIRHQKIAQAKEGTAWSYKGSPNDQ